MHIVKPSVELIWITPDPEKAIEFGARVCYKSEDKYDPSRTPAFLDKIIHQYHHESVVEHAAACFHIVCDRGVSHELVRHRLASFSQESTRYCNYGKDKFGGIALSPMMTGLSPQQVMRREQLWQHIEDVYLAEISEGVTPQQARDNLPTCLKTELRMTANFREWMHIIKLRTAPSAHPQIRIIANEIQRILQESAPAIFGSQPST
jgi:thymidylate synthase (FAD)